jgi:hypothetical protein
MKLPAPRTIFRRSSIKDGAWRRRPVIFRLVWWVDGSRKTLVLGVFERRWSWSTFRWIWRDLGSNEERAGSIKHRRGRGWSWIRV